MEGSKLVKELIQGKELAHQLRNDLKDSSSQETNQFLIEKILCSYGRAISILHHCDSSAEETKPRINQSHGSESSDVDSKNVLKRRKISEKTTERVKVCLGSGQERSLDDGFCWRKYGQKCILGCKNPRGYYRCTHRFARGCLATKKVQRSDSDPSEFEITYMGMHTCNVATAFVPAATTTTTSVNQVFEKDKDQLCEEQQRQFKEQRPRISQPDTFLNLDESDSKKAIFRTFSFTNIPSIEPEIISVSPATSGSDYFTLSQCDIMDNGLGCNVQTPRSDITHEITSSAPTSVTNSPIQIGDFDFKSLDDLDFDVNFPLDGYV